MTNSVTEQVDLNHVQQLEVAAYDQTVCGQLFFHVEDQTTAPVDRLVLGTMHHFEFREMFQRAIVLSPYR